MPAQTKKDLIERGLIWFKKNPISTSKVKFSPIWNQNMGSTGINLVMIS